MSEEQRKSKSRQLKKLSYIILPLLVIFVITVSYIMTRGPEYGTEIPSPCYSYAAARDAIGEAIARYASAHNGSLPTLNGTYANANCSNCRVVNFSALIINNYLRPNHIYGRYLSTDGNDNCGGNASLGCSNEGSYIWIVDTNGSVFSYCAGTGCTTNNTGCQDVWP